MSDTRKGPPKDEKKVAIREAMRRLGDDVMKQLVTDERLNRAIADKHVREKEPD